MSDTRQDRRRQATRTWAWAARLPLRFSELGEAFLGLLFFWR